MEKINLADVKEALKALFAKEKEAVESFWKYRKLFPIPFYHLVLAV